MAPAESRAVSEVIGAVIIFGFVVISFSLYQGVVIPDQNRAIEFEHNLIVQQAVQDLRNAIRQTGATGAEESVTVTLGATYPERAIGINPGVSAGSLQTRSVGAARIANITAIDAETKDYVGPSSPSLGPFASETIVYSPLYTRYTEAPVTVYENSVVANRFPGGQNISITDQAIVEGREITLLVLNGSLSNARQGPVTVDTEALSTMTTTVLVTNETGPINVTIPTHLTAADWRELLSEQLDTPGPDERYVTAVEQTGPDRVSIILEPNETYELRMAKVGVGSDTTSTDARYITAVSGDNTSVAEGGTQQLVVEVRDRFNNPVSGVTVDAVVTESAGDDAVTPASATTDASGRATFVYTAPDLANQSLGATVEVTYETPALANETATFDLNIAGEGGTLITLKDVTPTGTSPFEGVTFEVNNTASSPVNLTGLALNYATTTDNNAELQDGPNQVDSVTVDGTTKPVTAVEGQAPVFLSGPFSLPGNGSVTAVDLGLDETYQLNNKQSIVISVRFFFAGGIRTQWSVYIFEA